MKDRSTAVCTLNGRILLVTRDRSPMPSRWSLPGGKIKLVETPLEACRRELKEETAIDPLRLDFLFHFGGFAKRHHVFLADLAPDVAPEPHNEILRCSWFHPPEIAALPTSIPTREIIRLFVTSHDSQFSPDRDGMA